MSPERFRSLADSYGGGVVRWPDAERSAAERLMHDPAARALLEDAASIDAMLDAWQPPPPSAALVGRIVAAAPVAEWIDRTKIWWSGLGLAAALAGAMAGSLGAAAFAPDVVTWEGATAFGDMGEGGQ